MSVLFSEIWMDGHKIEEAFVRDDAIPRPGGMWRVSRHDIISGIAEEVSLPIEKVDWIGSRSGTFDKLQITLCSPFLQQPID
jgi:hypothetical protein